MKISHETRIYFLPTVTSVDPDKGRRPRTRKMHFIFHFAFLILKVDMGKVKVKKYINSSKSRVKGTRSCILLLGSTGTGKSSTIGKCTGQQVTVGHGKHSVTVTCDTYTGWSMSNVVM